MRTAINKRDIIITGVTLLVGLFSGWLFFHSPGTEPPVGNKGQSEVEAGHDHVSGQADETIYTCSMHPQIKQEKPGKCPICAMDLVPMSSLESEGDHVDPNEIQMTESAMALASIQTTIVQKGTPEKQLYLQGKVQADERRISDLTARFGGRIEDLYINYTGQQVQKGEPLGTIYSPTLITAQKELLEAVKYKDSNAALYKAARTKLKLWNLTTQQIDGIEKNGETQSYLEIQSPVSGTITRRHVSPGDYINEGSALFDVVDLSKVWVMFDAYEIDLPWISRGDSISFKVQSRPREKYTGTVDFIDPFIDERTRVASVRVALDNPDQLLKPGMFVSGVLTSNAARNFNEILIPKSSILWTGKRSVVYVKVPERQTNSFIYREIELGPEAGNFYVVTDGLAVGEEIATNGVFKIDAAAQLAGKSSMMNPDGGMGMSGHNHGGESFRQMESTHDIQKNSLTATISDAARNELRPLYDTYLEMTETLANDDVEDASVAGVNLKNVLDNIDMMEFKGEAHDIWMKHSSTLEKKIDEIGKLTSIEEIRAAYKGISDAMIALARSFGSPGNLLYIQYCPMANNDEGANWISSYSEIRNPYFGDMMLACGETKDTIQ